MSTRGTAGKDTRALCKHTRDEMLHLIAGSGSVCSNGVCIFACVTFLSVA